MDSIQIAVNGKQCIVVGAEQLHELCSQLDDLSCQLRDAMSLPANLAGAAVGRKGEAAPTFQLPKHRCPECARLLVEQAGALCAGCIDRLKRAGLGSNRPHDLTRASEPVSHRAHNPESGVQLPGPQPDSARPHTPAPDARALSSSCGARTNNGVSGLGIAAHAEEIARKRRANSGLNVAVVEALREMGQGNIETILAALEAAGKPVEGDDPERAISSVLYYQHTKHVVEQVEGKRGMWRIAA
jgi:hypothetical protein